MDSEDEEREQINPRLERLREIRLERLRNNIRTPIIRMNDESQ
jgi:hypothetical protein